ncbi:hypothetical protein E2P81_ATG03197 [Venturia nashicola]|uniref:BTB domain-containing protein n=1 Tax=Venturia nashicola TaxID=86259 RepID=A0A4Z1PEP2_9PEZI|nr:hypothetical protein E6O75_ATG03267 [Venturia nashicola]TLD36308.1 hypothetical protein E2P81_ATG03197 [Venturia nashicola]
MSHPRRARYDSNANPMMSSPTNEQAKPPRIIEFATIYVGPSRISFSIPVEAASTHSPFFANAFQGKFKEGKTKVMEMAYDEPRTFRCFAHWIYQQAGIPSGADSESEMENTLKMYDLAIIWIFADRIRAAGFQNYVMDLILERYNDYHGTNISVETFNHVYQNTLAGSQLRHAFVDLAAHKMSPSWYNIHKGDLEVEFLEELCLAQMTKDRFSVDPRPSAEYKLHNFMYHVETDEALKEQEAAAAARAKAHEKEQATREQMENRKVLDVKSVRRRHLNVPPI